MQNNPTISIIIPVYNVEKYILTCLDSVLSQTYKDWECICVNDGSSDNSGTYLDKYVLIDSRFQVIHQANAGVSTARNAGLKIAKGKWICFIDSDDWVSPYYLQHLVDAQKENVDYIVSGYDSILDGHTISHTIPTYACTFRLDSAAEDSFVDLLSKHLLNGPVCKLFCRVLIQSHHIEFPVDTEYGEDLLFNYKYLKYVNKIATVPISDYYYRQLLGTSLSHKSRPNRFDNEYYQWHVRHDFLISRNLWTNSIQQYMYQQLWGIVYDGLFESSANCTCTYIRHILSIPEITELASNSINFKASPWILWAILHRQTCFFWLFRKIY